MGCLSLIVEFKEKSRFFSYTTNTFRRFRLLQQLMKYISNNFRYSSPMYCRRLPIQNLLQKYAHQSRHLRMVLSIIQESYSYVLCMLCFSIRKTFRMCACLSVVVRNYQKSFHVKEKKKQ